VIDLSDSLPGIIAAAVALAAWCWLALLHGGFWRADARLAESPPSLTSPPPVVAVIPARNEALTVGAAVAALLDQDYPGRLSVVVVDDRSDDGTAAAVQAAAGNPRIDRDLRVVSGAPLPAGWSGKLWAVQQGVEDARASTSEATYVLLTDADVVHGPDVLRRLVAKAEGEALDLVSLMVLLRCRSGWERLLIPAFVFFFQKLYPFPWVNDPGRRTAAAAGGCILVRRHALEAVGGVAAVRDRLIDDCALAELVKRHGSVWLGLADDSRSLRAYDDLGSVWGMVTRTAFTQLRHSAALLAGTVLGMTLLYLVPPMAAAWGAATGNLTVGVPGGVAWLLMAALYRPTLRLYGLPAAWGLALPAAAFLFTLMTLDSARRHWAGHGPAWKGRHYGGRRVTSGGGCCNHTVMQGTQAGIAVDADADDCAEAVVRRSGTSFYWAMRVLDPERRRAMYAIYAFCREVDDIADDAGLVTEKRRRLAAWRQEIEALFEGWPSSLVARALTTSVHRFGLRKEDFVAIIDGMEMDAADRLRIADVDELMLYCDRVACAVGRLSSRVFGLDEATGGRLADSLGKALQLTNILRDLDDDARRDRLYLPADMLAASGANTADGPDEVLRHPGAREVCRHLADRARACFADAAAVLARCDRRQVRAATIMMEIYRRTLRRLMERGWDRWLEPVSVPPLEKLWVAVRYGVI